MSFANNTSNPIDSGFGYSNAALGIINSYTQMSRFMEGSFVYNNREAYIQDNWKVNSKLTLDYGVRFVHQQPQYDELLQGSNFLPETWDAVAGAGAQYVAGCANGVYPCSGTNRQAMDPRNNQFLGPHSALSIGQLVPGTGNLTNGIFVVRTGHRQDRIHVADAGAGAAVRVGLRRQRQAAVHLARRHRPLLRPPGRQLDLRPGGESAERVDRHDQLRAAADADVEHHRAAGADGLRIRRQAAVVSAVEHGRADGTAVVLRSRRRRMWVSTATTWDRPSTSTRSTSGRAYLPQNQDRTLNPLHDWSERARDGFDARVPRLRTDQPVLGPRLEQVPFDPDVLQPPVHGRALVRRELDARPVEHDQLGGPAATRGGRPARSYRADQEEADRLLGRGQLQRHTIKGTFVWDLPGPRTRHQHGHAGARRGGQRLAAVGHLQRSVGRSIQPRVRLSGRSRQREHHGVAQLRRTRDPQRGSRVGLFGQSVRSSSTPRASPAPCREASGSSPARIT